MAKEPWRLLPFEVLAKIFIMASEGDDLPYGYGICSVPLAISEVCSQWRTIALETPLIWTRIRIGDEVKTRIGRAWLKRSKHYPVSITCAIGTSRIPEHMNLICAHMDRIEHLTITVANAQCNQVIKALNKPAPILRSFALGRDHKCSPHPYFRDTIASTVFGKHSPGLETLQITSPSSWPAGLMSNVTKLGLVSLGGPGGNLIQVLRLLEGAPRLFALKVTSDWHSSSKGSTDYWRSWTILPPSGFKVITLFNLVEAYFSKECFDKVILVLHYLDLPNLSILQLHCDNFRCAPNYPTPLHTFPSLHTLKISAHIYDDRDPFMTYLPELLHQCKNLTHLYLTESLFVLKIISEGVSTPTQGFQVLCPQLVHLHLSRFFFLELDGQKLKSFLEDKFRVEEVASLETLFFEDTGYHSMGVQVEAKAGRYRRFVTGSVHCNGKRLGPVSVP